ncbi:MAG: hypothetical protein KC621_14605 [Myxococcales bacterium]|nr:hypothetical protein [Myxococcales bacterium]
MSPLLLPLVMVGCKKATTPTDTTTGDTGTAAPDNLYPLPDDIDEIDFESAFIEAVRMMTTVTTQAPWKGHVAAIDRREVGCPDFWTDPFTIANQTVGSEDGVAWNDDCLTTSGLVYDGWIWWDSTVRNSGQADTYEGRTSEGSRRLEGKATVSTTDDITFEFVGEASDSLYRVQAVGYDRFVYSTRMDATVTGRDVFETDSPTPDGYRTDLVMSLTGGDVDNFEARGNVYTFYPQLQGRFDSIGVDMELQGPLGAGPDSCTLEPLGWIGLRDENAYWYDVVFLPRFQEDIVDIDYANDPLSICDGCGRLYVQGIEQEGREICIDFSFLFDGTVHLPEIEEYVLPWHSL